MRLPAAPSSTTTDAVFTAYQKTVKGKPVDREEEAPKWVPRNDDSLFVSVLRSMLLFKEGGGEGGKEDAFGIMAQRLKDAAQRYGKTPLRLKWTPSKKSERESSSVEIEDVRRLRAIVAAHVHENFVWYYKHHRSVYADLWNGILEWTPYNPESGVGMAAHKKSTDRWRERTQKLISLDSTSAYLRDALSAALKYDAEGKGECTERCLDAIRDFREDASHIRHEVRDALVITIETPYQEAPTLVLDALADLLGVHIDLYFQEQVTLDAVAAKGAECTESYGPSRDDDTALQRLKTQYNKVDIDDFPLFDVVVMAFEQEQQMFYGYSIPVRAEVKLNARTPALEEDGYDDALLEFYVALENGEVLGDLPTFVDPCVEGAQDPNQAAALVRAQLMEGDEGEEGEKGEEGEEGDSQATGDDPNDSDYEQPQDGDAGDGVGDDDDAGDAGDDADADAGGDDDAPQVESGSSGPSVPIRLRPFANADYRMGQHDAPISVEQEQWAKARLRKAHAHFLAHVSSRKGYGCIMLMQDPHGDASVPILAPTGGEAAKSKETNRRIWARLKASPLSQVVNLTEFIENEFDHKLRNRISADRGATYQANQRDFAEEEKGSEAYNLAKAWLESHYLDKRKQLGLFTALRLVNSANLPFAGNSEGGWVALLTWWKRLRDAAEAAGVAETGWEMDREEGKWLCRTHYAANSDDAHVNDASTRRWRSLWEFLNALRGRLGRSSPETLSAIERLTEDTTFQESTSWASLGYQVELGS